MCTGNLRSGTELLFLGLSKKDKSIAIRSLTYYGINLFFVIGAIVGAVVTKYLDVKSVFIASALLIIPFIMMFKQAKMLSIYNLCYIKKNSPAVSFHIERKQRGYFIYFVLKLKYIYKAVRL